MLIKRQDPTETQPNIPDNIDQKKYGEIICNIDGQIYCRDKDGIFKSLATSSLYAETANKVKDLPSVGVEVPSNAVFSDHIYTFEEGEENGSFKVNYQILGPISEGTPTGNQIIKIHGLGSAAFEDSNSFLDKSSASSFITKEQLKNEEQDKISINATALSGSTLQDILNYIDEKFSSNQ